MRASPRCSSESPCGDGMTNRVTDNPARSRYELLLEGGVGARLVGGALQLACEQGVRIKARCSYVAQFIERNPQFQDLLQQP
jgi:hypothetical protein